MFLRQLLWTEFGRKQKQGASRRLQKGSRWEMTVTCTKKVAAEIERSKEIQARFLS